MSNSKHPIPMTLERLEGCRPAGGNAAGAPVADDVGLESERFGQGGDAPGSGNGLIEDGHAPDYGTVGHKSEQYSETFVTPSSPGMDTLAKRLEHARTRKGEIWTQRHLAVVSGVSAATIGMLERGRRGVSDRARCRGRSRP